MVRRSLIALLAVAAWVGCHPGIGWARTFYVDASNGNDLFGSLLSQNPSFPLKTIKKGISFAVGGDTVIVKPGTYMEAVESKRDGTATSPIILQSSAVGGAV